MTVLLDDVWFGNTVLSWYQEALYFSLENSEIAQCQSISTLA